MKIVIKWDFKINLFKYQIDLLNTLRYFIIKSKIYHISRALLKCEYDKFSLEIIKYCDASIVFIR